MRQRGRDDRGRAGARFRSHIHFRSPRRENVQRKITVTGNVAVEITAASSKTRAAPADAVTLPTGLPHRVQRTVREQRAGVNSAVLAQARRHRLDVLHAGGGIPIGAAGRTHHGQLAGGGDRRYRRVFASGGVLSVASFIG
jgi:hypothetical protein